MNRNKIINVKNIFEEYKFKLKIELDNIKKNLKKIPTLAVILVGNSLESITYINSKKKICEDLGIKFKLFHLDDDIEEKKLIELIKFINMNNEVEGYILQLPLPKKFNENKILNYIDPKKDIDGLTNINLGKLLYGSPLYIPCTAKGISTIIDYIKYDIKGKNAAIIGRSNIVGKPTSMLLLSRDATVTMCHSKTKNLEKICQNMDILIVAIGKEKFIKSSYVKKGALVIDVGINRNKINKKILGDVDLEDVYPKISRITSVPGGVGLMTVISLIENFIICLKNK